MTGAPRIRAIRPFTMRVVNPITRRFAGWLPGFGLLTHVGRTSGRSYTTPINVFRRGGHHLVALTYGSDVQWVKNVFAAGGCTLRTRGHTIRLVDPELITDPSLGLLPLPVRLFLRPMRVTQVLRLREADGPTS
jgi:deazaflavin-dependent oxidoreductase (nitroreductase family)